MFSLLWILATREAINGFQKTDQLTPSSHLKVRSEYDYFKIFSDKRYFIYNINTLRTQEHRLIEIPSNNLTWLKKERKKERKKAWVRKRREGD